MAMRMTLMLFLSLPMCLGSKTPPVPRMDKQIFTVFFFLDFFLDSTGISDHWKTFTIVGVLVTFLVIMMNNGAERCIPLREESS